MSQQGRFKDIRHFSGGAGMNLDDDARLLEPNDHREIYNSIISVSESNNVNGLEAIKGTLDVLALPINRSVEMPQGIKCVGSCEDIAQNAVILFLCDTSGNGNHGILRHYNVDSSCEWILKNEPLLNFKPDHPINGAVRIGDLLYWTDGYFNSYIGSDYNPPRKINVPKAVSYTNYKPLAWTFDEVGEAATITGLQTFEGFTAYLGNVPYPQPHLEVVAFAPDGILRNKYVSGHGSVIYTGFHNGKHCLVTSRPWKYESKATRSVQGHVLPQEPGMYFGIDWQVMEVVKYKPLTAPKSVYASDTTKPANYLKNKLFQFAYRHIYDDYEKTVLSPISEIPFPSIAEIINGSYYGETINNNVINVLIDTGPMEVVCVEILAREGTTGNWKIVSQIDKFTRDGICLVSSDVDFLYPFYNDGCGETPADTADLSRVFDHVPEVSLTQDIIEKNRLIYANYIEGKNNVDIGLVASYRFKTLPASTNYYAYEQVKVGDGHNFLIQIGQNEYCVFYDDYLYDLSPHFGVGRVVQIYMTNESSETVSVSLAVDESDTYPDFLQKFAAAINSLPNCSSSTYTDALGDCVLHPYEQDVVMRSFRGSVYGNKIIVSCRVNINPIQVGLPTPPRPRQQYINIYVFEPDNKRYACFKSGAKHFFGVVYGMTQGYEGNVNISETSVVEIPYFPTANSTPPLNGFDKNQLNYAVIDWKLSNKPPDFADWYQIYYGGSSIAYYLDYIVPSSSITRSQSENETPYVKIAFNQEIVNAYEKIANYNLPNYVWEKGDRIRFCFLDNGDKTRSYFTQTIDREIIAIRYPGDETAYKYDLIGEHIFTAEGNKVLDNNKTFLIVEDFDLNALGISNDSLRQKVILEIYRMRAVSAEGIVYFPVTPRIKIIDPHTTSAMHGAGEGGAAQQNNSPASGTIQFGDSFLKLRFNGTYSFPVEASEFSDYYTTFTQNRGQANIVNRFAKQQHYRTNIRYGGRYIENTQVNDLSKFLADDFISLPEKFGPINYIKEVGFTLKVVQLYKQSSIYIGRQGLTQADVGGDDIISASTNTLGTVVHSKTSYGTAHPLSCHHHENAIYGYDVNSGVIWRDSGNGIRSISHHEDGESGRSYKIKLLTQTKSRTFQKHTVDVFTVYDGRYDIVYFCFVDRTDSSESYTIGFHEPSNRWISFYSFIPDFIASMKQYVLSWRYSKLWLHNEGTRMNFYGQQYAQSLKTVSNTNPLTKKRFLAITLYSEKAWGLPNPGDVYIPPNDTYARGQVSLIKQAAFRPIEGSYYAPFGKDMTTHQISPTNDDYINGDDLRGEWIELNLKNTTVERNLLFSVSVDSIQSQP